MVIPPSGMVYIPQGGGTKGNLAHWKLALTQQAEQAVAVDLAILGILQIKRSV